MSLLCSLQLATKCSIGFQFAPPISQSSVERESMKYLQYFRFFSLLWTAQNIQSFTLCRNGRVSQHSSVTTALSSSRDTVSLPKFASIAVASVLPFLFNYNGDLNQITINSGPEHAAADSTGKVTVDLINDRSFLIVVECWNRSS